LEIKEIQRQEIDMAIYTMQSLCIKGISVPETIRMSLQNLVQWYEFTKESKYIETALMHLCALSEMGMMRDSDAELYNTVCKYAGWGEMECWKYGLYMTKKIKPNKTQVKALIQRWKPSHDNPMAIGEVVSDIMDKVKNKKAGHYYYSYVRSYERNSNRNKAIEKDIYKLIVETDQSYFWDIKHFKCYTFAE